MTQNPEVYSKLTGELEQPPSSLGADPSLPKNEEFEYLHKCINETMRRHPSIVFVPPRQMINDTRLGDFNIPPWCTSPSLAFASFPLYHSLRTHY